MNVRFAHLGFYFEVIRKIESICEKSVKSLWIKSKTDKAEMKFNFLSLKI
jgi:hypothetical protein